MPRAKLDELGIPIHGELYAWMLSPEVVFESMVRRLATDEARVQEILNNRLYQHLSKIVAGMQEYTAAEALYTLSTEGKYDLVVLDTPPSRNALEFLEAPRKLSMFLDERVIGVFLPKKGAFMRAASDLIERVFSRAFGEGFYKELQGFLGAFSGMFGGMRAHAEAVRKLLSSDEAAFLLVTSPEPAALAEASFFQAEDQGARAAVRGLRAQSKLGLYTRFRRAGDDPAPDPTRPRSSASRSRSSGQLADAERWRAQRDRDLLARLRMETESGSAIATPHLGGAVEDLVGLGTLARNLVRIESA